MICKCSIDQVTIFLKIGQKSGLMVSVLDSWLEGHGFKSCPIRDGNGVKAMPGSIPAPNSGSSIIKKEKKI